MLPTPDSEISRDVDLLFVSKQVSDSGIFLKLLCIKLYTQLHGVPHVFVNVYTVAQM
jgi:hypothetical protein